MFSPAAYSAQFGPFILGINYNLQGNWRLKMKRAQTQWFKLALLTSLMASAYPLHAAPSDVRLTLVELNDLHANLVGHKDLVRNPDGTTKVEIRGGMARMKTVMNRIRKENPNTLLMTIGDTYHGGVEAFYSLGNAVHDPLMALAPDVGVPGNWDYYFTPAVTRARYGRIDKEDIDVVQVTFDGIANPIPVKRPLFPNLGANVKDITDIFMPKDFLPPTHMITRQGVKIGFIGFTSDIVEMMQPLLAEGMDFAHGLEEHKNLLIEHAKKLRSQGADLVVVMSELGVNKNVDLSKALGQMSAKGELPPGLIDMFFSAHTHEAISVPIKTADDGVALYAPVVEAGNDGYLGRLDVTMKYKNSTTTGRPWKTVTEQNWAPASMSWKLITINESIPEDPAVKAMVDKERSIFLAKDVNMMAVPFFMQRLKQPIDTVIGRIAPGAIISQQNLMSGVMSRDGTLSSTFNVALTNMMRDVTGTELAITPGFRMGTAVPEAGFLMENGAVATGDITLEDAYRFFPMYYGLVTATTTGAHMKGVIEGVLKAVYSADAFNTQGGWAYGFAGLDIDVDLKAGDGRRVKALRHASTGLPVQDNEVMTIAGCRRLPIDFRGTLCGIGGFENLKTIKEPGGMLPWSFVDMFTYMLQNKSYALHSEAGTITDTSYTPMWPTTEIRQPVNGVGAYYEPHNPQDPCRYFKWQCNSELVEPDPALGDALGLQ